MRRVIPRALGALLLLALLLVPLVASAHQSTTDAGYDIEYGWVNEPVIINQPNAVVINIARHQDVTSTTALSSTAQVDISGLVLVASYGGQTKTLKLQPLGENTPGQFVAPMLPTVAGLYTLQLSGQIDGQAIQTIQVQPEEVQTPDVVQFPNVPDPVAGLNDKLAAAQSQAGTAQLIAIAGVVLGLIGTAVGVFGLVRKR